jgi:hypothetical protein
VAAVLAVLASGLAVVGVRAAVLAALRRAVAREERCLSAYRDREWAAVEPRWSGR